jgi:squalene cyclase
MKVFFLMFLMAGSLLGGDLDSSIDKGVEFLLAEQNPDGSFGGPGRTKGLNIYAPGPGAHLDFKTAVTALCMMSLCQLESESKEVRKSISRANHYLLLNYSKVKRVNALWVGNVWSHCYILKAMLTARKKTYLAPHKKAIDVCVRQQIKDLATYQYLDGGWGYYDFKHHTDKPSGTSMSFTTASCLLSLQEAQAAGFEVSLKVIEKALFQLKRQRRPDNCFLYSSSFHFYRNRSINKPQGSLARSQSALQALYLYKQSGVEVKHLEEWVGKLIKMNGWLDMGRKRPKPHESWYAVAGYFYYYGHYYAAGNLRYCSAKKKPLAKSLAKILIPKQEKNGSWFDFPLYDYGHFYGTAYALMALQDCRTALK